MGLSLDDLKSVARHALGGSPAVVYTDADTTLTQYVNEAGRHLFMMHDWRFAVRTRTTAGDPITLNFTANQSYVALPADLGQITDYAGSVALVRGFHLTTLQELATYRNALVPVTWEYAGAVSFPGQTTDADEAGTPILELYPTPVANVTAALTIGYRSQWTDLSDDGNVANIPRQIESLLVQLVRAWAKGAEEGTQNSLISDVEAGPVFAAAMKFDGGVQADIGRPNGGAALQQMDRTEYRISTVPNPT